MIMRMGSLAFIYACIQGNSLRITSGRAQGKDQNLDVG